MTKGPRFAVDPRLTLCRDADGGYNSGIDIVDSSGGDLWERHPICLLVHWSAQLREPW